ncbi:hypothetical protein [Streptomyces sp. NPDC087539]|uniref:hypothetical protein n=1 Tax=Streptomyces sp. NPDC087539 TaxID=3365798 RepID=UPI00380E9CEC
MGRHPAPQPMTSEQQRAQAHGFVVAALPALSQGVDKPFAFSLPPLNAGSSARPGLADLMSDMAGGPVWA